MVGVMNAIAHHIGKLLLPLAEIRLDGGTQSRAALSPDTVSEYSALYRDGRALPPVTVFYDGTTYWLADGFHRCAGANEAGMDALPAEIQQGTQRDAILYSVGANTKHGLPRTNADKRRAVELLLRDDEWSQKSDRWIAERCGVHHETVAKWRPSFAPTGEIASSNTRPIRLGQDGKVRRMPERDVREEAVERLRAGESQCDVAAALGVPNTTVQNWKDKAGLPRTRARPKPRPETVERDMAVLELHNEGLGSAEIARRLGIETNQVSHSKARLGIAATSAGVKLWADVDHVATLLEGTELQVSEIVDRLEGAADFTADAAEISRCINSLLKSRQTVSRFISALKQRLP
jgi:transposase-like protein